MKGEFEIVGDNDMVVENIPKSLAELYKSLLLELKPSWNVNIITEDYNLYKLGFIDEIPCSLSLDICDEQIRKLHDEIIDMEIGVYLYEDLLYKDPKHMTVEERELFKEIKKREKNMKNLHH